MPLSQQIKGLHDDLYDVGFAQSDEVGEGIVAIPVWSDALMVAVPARHPLLVHKRIPLRNCSATLSFCASPQVWKATRNTFIGAWGPGVDGNPHRGARGLCDL